jgi:rhomboid protease GluP
VLKAIAFLVAMNVVLWWAMDGHLAWQTHLGGFRGGRRSPPSLGQSASAPRQPLHFGPMT